MDARLWIIQLLLLHSMIACSVRFLSRQAAVSIASFSGSVSRFLGMALLLLVVSNHLVADDAPSPSEQEWAVLNQATDGAFVRPQDQVWIASTRCLADCTWIHDPNPPLDIRRLDAHCVWQPASIEALLESQSPEQITIIYVHGNRVEWCDSIHRGLRHYRNIVCDDPHGRPIQYIIWAWPSDKIRGQVRDVRAKAERTHDEGHFLGTLIAKMDPNVPLSFIGYSFGARVVMGALHEYPMQPGVTYPAQPVLAGEPLAAETVTARPVLAVDAELPESAPPEAGSLEAGSLEAGSLEAESLEPTALPRARIVPPRQWVTPPRQPVRVVLIAAAIRSDALVPGNEYSNALGLIDQALVVYNSRDPVLKRYPLLERGPRRLAQALGMTGVAFNLDAVAGTRIRQFDARNLVGRGHDEYAYLDSAGIIGPLREFVLWRPVR